MTWCPRCYQGWVLRAQVTALGLGIWICEECDALWTNGPTADLAGFADKSVLLERHGLQDSWSEITLLEESVTRQQKAPGATRGPNLP